MPRIAFISVHGCPLAELGTKNAGGMNVYIGQLAQHLGRLGFNVDIFTRIHQADTPVVEEYSENVRIIHIDAGPANVAKEEIFDHLPDFVAKAKEYQAREAVPYDALHTHYWLSGWVGQRLSQDWHIPHVTTFHTLSEIKSRAHIGTDEATSRSVTEGQVAEGADRIIVSTSHERDALKQLYAVSQENVRVVSGGVDLSLFQPGNQQAAKTKLGVGGSQTLLYVGRLDPIKGVEVLIHTVSQITTSRNIEVLIVGGHSSDPEYQRLSEIARELAILDRIDFVGAQNHDLLPTYYQAADICVVPSYYESFGLVALEAMACGTPVVASRVPGLQTIVRDNRSGYIVPWHCPDAFADRLEILLSNDALRECMGSNAREIAMSMSWDRSAQEVANVYSELGVS